MLKGAVGFSMKRANWLSKAIGWFTRSRWSHCFVFYQVEPDALVAETGTFTVQIVPADKYSSRKYDVEYFLPTGLDPEKVSQGVTLVRGLVERTYGWIQLLGFIPMIALRKLGFKVKNPAVGGIVCSELAFVYLELADPEGGWGEMDRNSVSPQDLYEKIQGSPRWTRMERTAA